MIELFVKLVNGSQQLTNFAKYSILNVWLDSECAFVIVLDEHQYQYGMENFQLKIGGWNPNSGKQHCNHNKEGWT